MLTLLLFWGCGGNGTGLSNVTNTTEGALGDPVMTVDPLELFITDCAIDSARSGSVNVASAGDGDLEIYKIELLGDESIFYFIPQSDLTFSPGVSDSYAISASIDSDAPAEAELRITSNDPNMRDVRVPIHAWPVGYVPPDTGDTGQ